MKKDAQIFWHTQPKASPWVVVPATSHWLSTLQLIAGGGQGLVRSSVPDPQKVAPMCSNQSCPPRMSGIRLQSQIAMWRNAAEPAVLQEHRHKAQALSSMCS